MAAGTSNRLLLCYDNDVTTTITCPADRIAIYVTQRRDSIAIVDYLSWLGICEEIDTMKLYENHATMLGLYK